MGIVNEVKRRVDEFLAKRGNASNLTVRELMEGIGLDAAYLDRRDIKPGNKG